MCLDDVAYLRGMHTDVANRGHDCGTILCEASRLEYIQIHAKANRVPSSLPDNMISFSWTSRLIYMPFKRQELVDIHLVRICLQVCTISYIATAVGGSLHLSAWKVEPFSDRRSNLSFPRQERQLVGIYVHREAWCQIIPTCECFWASSSIVQKRVRFFLVLLVWCTYVFIPDFAVFSLPGKWVSIFYGQKPIATFMKWLLEIQMWANYFGTEEGVCIEFRATPNRNPKGDE